MRKFIYSWKGASNGARELSRALGIPRIRHEHSRYKPVKDDVVINWGSSTIPVIPDMTNVLNKPQQVFFGANKLSFFRLCKDAGKDGPRTPRWTEHPDVAHDWLLNGKTVVARRILTGHSGNGIIIVNPGDKMVDAPLYTMYVKKEAEYRIHLMKGKDNGVHVIDVQRKIRDPNREPTNWKVRSHANGFIFVRNGVEAPPDVLQQATLALMVSRLDFGAVDVLSGSDGRGYVLEINTAPGLEGQTVINYANGFKEYFGL